MLHSPRNSSEMHDTKPELFSISKLKSIKLVRAVELESKSLSLGLFGRRV